jgi:hypothetical protein
MLMSVSLEPEPNGGAWTRLFHLFLAGYPHLHMEKTTRSGTWLVSRNAGSRKQRTVGSAGGPGHITG